MKKTGSSFKIKQSTKRQMMSILDAHERGAFKRMMIAAQLAEMSGAQRVRVKQSQVEESEE